MIYVILALFTIVYVTMYLQAKSSTNLDPLPMGIFDAEATAETQADLFDASVYFPERDMHYYHQERLLEELASASPEERKRLMGAL